MRADATQPQGVKNGVEDVHQRIRMSRYGSAGSRMRLGGFIAAGALALASGLGAAAGAETQIDRVGAGAFPISSVVVVSNLGGADIAYASGATAPAEPGQPVKGDTKAQTIGALTRLATVLKAKGFSLGDVVMMRVFLVGDPALGGKMDFAGMMGGYTQFFGAADQPAKPARTTVQVSGLAAPGALVEIEVQAVRPRK
jgi:enamine deaminase RidA (YjgF/YER057c/UK114 family)